MIMIPKKYAADDLMIIPRKQYELFMGAERELKKIARDRDLAERKLLRSLRQSQKEFKQGKGKVLRSLRDLM